ncbi:LOW QUALITY PROTEIN: asparaginase/glutaminase, partial [Brucella melitensis bv. 3 str. Ether]
EDRQDGSPQNSHRFHRRNHRLALRSANGFAVERFDRKGTSILSRCACPCSRCCS